MMHSFLFISFFIAIAAFTPSVQAAEAASDVQTAQPSHKRSFVTVKKLTHPNMGMFDVQLRNNPEILVRMTLTTQAIKKLLTELEFTEAQTMATADEQKYVATKLAAVLEPICEFFDVINEYRIFVRWLLVESLGTSKQTTNDLLMKYFESHHTIDSFCSKEITTRAVLKLFITDMLQFFGDIHASISPETHAAYKAEIARIKESKQKRSAQATAQS